MKLSEKILCAAFLIIAIVSLVFAICCFGSSTPSGRTAVHEYYGGDAYTGIQNASADAATNVYYAGKAIAQIIINFGGYFFIIVALTFASLSVSKLIQFKEKASNDSTGQEITVEGNNATENA